MLVAIVLAIEGKVIVTRVRPNRGSLAGGTRLHIQVAQREELRDLVPHGSHSVSKHGVRGSCLVRFDLTRCRPCVHLNESPAGFRLLNEHRRDRECC